MSLDNLSRGTKREENSKEEGSKGDFLVQNDKLVSEPLLRGLSAAGKDYSHMQLYIFISINCTLIGTGDEENLLY